MTSYKDIYPSNNWLKADDLGGIGGHEPVVVIEDVFVSQFKDRNTNQEKQQLCLKFTGKEKALGLNKTNAEKLGALFGEDFTGWVGQAIQLWVDQTSLGPGVRVRKAPTSVPAVQAPNARELAESDVDAALRGDYKPADDIKF